MGLWTRICNICFLVHINWLVCPISRSVVLSGKTSRLFRRKAAGTSSAPSFPCDLVIKVQGGPRSCRRKHNHCFQVPNARRRRPRSSTSCSELTTFLSTPFTGEEPNVYWQHARAGKSHLSFLSIQLYATQCHRATAACTRMYRARIHNSQGVRVWPKSKELLRNTLSLQACRKSR